MSVIDLTSTDLTDAGLFIALVLSLNLIVGFGRYLVFCHAAFYGIGAYTVAILSTTSPSLPAPLLLLTAMLLAGTAGLLVGLPISRTSGVYFAMITWGIGAIVSSLILNFDFTGGSVGKGPIQPPNLFGWHVSTVTGFLILAWALVGLLVVVLIIAVSSRIGWALRGIGEAPAAAQMLGMSPSRVLYSFIVSAALAGLAGGVYGYYVTYVSPSPFGLTLSILALVALILGGLGSVSGSILGAMFIVVAQDTLRAYPLRADLLFGLVLVVVIHLRPQGIVSARFERRVLRAVRSQLNRRSRPVG